MASYIDEVLIAGERVLHRARVSLWPYAPHIAAGVVLAVFLVGLVILGWVYIKIRSTEIAITSKRIIVKQGFISRSTVEINLAKVESVRVDQSLAGRFLDYGTLVIAGTGMAAASVKGIAEPLVFRRQFMSATDRPDDAGTR